VQVDWQLDDALIVLSSQDPTPKTVHLTSTDPRYPFTARAPLSYEGACSLTGH